MFISVFGFGVVRVFGFVLDEYDKGNPGFPSGGPRGYLCRQQVPRVGGAGVGGRDAPWPHQPGVPTAKGT